MILSIDPASRKAGISVWSGDTLIAAHALESKLPTWTERAHEMAGQLYSVTHTYTIEQCVIELVPKIAEPSVQIIAGALISQPHFKFDIRRAQFVSPSSWKAYVRRKDPSVKDPKGVKALEAIKWDFAKHPVESDDVADSILIYLAWSGK